MNRLSCLIVTPFACKGEDVQRWTNVSYGEAKYGISAGTDVGGLSQSELATLAANIQYTESFENDTATLMFVDVGTNPTLQVDLNGTQAANVSEFNATDKAVVQVCMRAACAPVCVWWWRGGPQAGVAVHRSCFTAERRLVPYWNMLQLLF